MPLMFTLIREASTPRMRMFCPLRGPFSELTTTDGCCSSMKGSDTAILFSCSSSRPMVEVVRGAFSPTLAVETVTSSSLRTVSCADTGVENGETAIARAQKAKIRPRLSCVASWCWQRPRLPCVFFMFLFLPPALPGSSYKGIFSALYPHSEEYRSTPMG